jgi:hypothetical protein
MLTKLTFHKKNLLLHILFWGSGLAYHCIWDIVCYENHYLYPVFFYRGLAACLFYLNYFILIPKLFLDKSLLSKWVAVFIYAFVFSITYVPALRYNQHLFLGHQVVYMLDSDIFTLVYLWLVSSGMRLAVYWEKTNKEIKSINEEKFERELKAFMNELSPLFMKTYMKELIRLSEYNKEDTKYAIIHFADLLRYSLYENKAGKVSVQREVEMMEEFALFCKSLQKEFDLKITINGEKNETSIKPMLWISFMQKIISVSDLGLKGKYTMKVDINENRWILSIGSADLINNIPGDMKIFENYNLTFKNSPSETIFYLSA